MAVFCLRRGAAQSAPGDRQPRRRGAGGVLLRAVLAALLPVFLSCASPPPLPEPDAPPDDDVTTTAPADDDPTVGRWSFAAVPRLTLNSDDGVGLGLRGTAFWQRYRTTPYKTALSFQAWVTTKLVQHHYVRVDAIKAFGAPLRIEAEAGYFHSLSQNYCGVGDDVECAPGDLSRLRFYSPYALSNVRLRVHDGGYRLEPFVGVRAQHYISGTWGDDGPYPGSAYAAAFPRGENGTASVVQAGVAFDSRDDEVNPTQGLTLEASARAAVPLWGSTWSFAGLSVTCRVFAPLLPGLLDRRLVFAQRIVVDAVGGDAPIMELARVGGLTDFLAYGGQDAGRGIRVQRFIGPLKAFAQQELRADVLHLDVWGNDLGLLAAAFVDVGVVSDADFRFGAAGPRPLFGAGLSGRVVWNRTFAMRLDLALSPLEGLRLGAYSAPGHPF